MRKNLFDVVTYLTPEAVFKADDLRNGDLSVKRSHLSVQSRDFLN